MAENMGVVEFRKIHYLTAEFSLNHCPVMFLPILKNPFANKNIPRLDFLAIMNGNIDRMTGLNTEGQYTPMIDALVPHRDAYASFLGVQDINLVERYGDTDEVEKVLADFKTFVKEELLVDVPYIFTRTKPNAPALTKFLPKGRSEYTGVTLETLPGLLDRVATLTTTYKNELGAALGTRAAELKQAYTDARKDQGESKGEVQDDSKEEKKLRKPASRQMKLNLLDQVKMHIDEPERVKTLYDQKIFTQPKPAKKAKKTSGTTPPATPQV